MSDFASTLPPPSLNNPPSTGGGSFLQPAHSGVSPAERVPRQEVIDIGLANLVPGELYRVQLKNFTSGILGEMADKWIWLFKPHLNYRGAVPVWWPASITFMSPRRMLKSGTTSAILPIFKANMAKIESHFSKNCSAES